MTPTLTQRLEWMRDGTRVFSEAVASLDKDAFDAPTPLPGWTRKHLIAHLAANADALRNLTRWASTGIETPMYASADERAAGIAEGPNLSASQLRSWLAQSAEKLSESVDQLSADQWQRPVRTAQGRTVPATETPWMRSREVWVHAVDLDAGVTFEQLPEGFNRALIADIRQKRGLQSLPVALTESNLPDVAAWLAGRPHSVPDAPPLGPWL